MTTELRIALGLASPEAVSLALQGAAVPNGLLLVQRPKLQLDAADIENFRRGKLEVQGFNNLVSKINDWLLDPELRTILAKSIGSNGKRLRLVFVLKDEVRALVNDVPLELLWHDTPDKWLLLRNDVEALVYKLEKAVNATSTLSSSNWPFRVLIIRSNPPDLGGQVPEVAALRDRILQQAAHFGEGMVQIDIISEEPGIDRPATWTNLREHLKLTSDYNVLVYLGHGEVVPAQTGGEPVGHLYMESEDGGGHQPISSPQLAKLLAKYPVPVVILTGCLTAADAPGVRSGGQGMAQALVNSSEAGVQVAVGMRTELRTDAALSFLEAFFSTLLKSKESGNIEYAVSMARGELFLDKPFPPSWAAPVIFRAAEQEPMIEYLGQPVSFRVSPKMQMLLEVRSTLWKRLPDLITQGAVSEGLPAFKIALADIQQSLRQEGLQEGPLLLPSGVAVIADQASEIEIELEGQLSVSTLACRLLIGGDAATVVDSSASEPVKQAGFQLLADQGNKSVFELRSNTAEARLLPAGTILKLSIKGKNVAPGLYPITLEVQKIDPLVRFWPGDSVLLVPRP
jgi:hypothetical protein